MPFDALRYFHFFCIKHQSNINMVVGMWKHYPRTTKQAKFFHTFTSCKIAGTVCAVVSTALLSEVTPDKPILSDCLRRAHNLLIKSIRMVLNVIFRCVNLLDNGPVYVWRKLLYKTVPDKSPDSMPPPAHIPELDSSPGPHWSGSPGPHWSGSPSSTQINDDKLLNLLKFINYKIYFLTFPTVHFLNLVWSEREKPGNLSIQGNTK